MNSMSRFASTRMAASSRMPRMKPLRAILVLSIMLLSGLMGCENDEPSSPAAAGAVVSSSVLPEGSTKTVTLERSRRPDGSQETNLVVAVTHPDGSNETHVWPFPGWHSSGFTDNFELSTGVTEIVDIWLDPSVADTNAIGPPL